MRAIWKLEQTAYLRRLYTAGTRREKIARPKLLQFHDSLVDRERLSWRALDHRHPSRTFARVQRRRRSAIQRARRSLRYIIENVHVPERDVVVAAALDLLGGDGRGAHVVGIFSIEAVRQRDVP